MSEVARVSGSSEISEIAVELTAREWSTCYVHFWPLETAAKACFKNRLLDWREETYG